VEKISEAGERGDASRDIGRYRGGGLRPITGRP